MTGSHQFLDGALRLLRRATRRATGTPSTPRRTDAGRGRSTGYPGDFTGRPTIVYRPHNDNRPDPGEVVWAWVPYEEDHTQGKDRPVLLIGRDDGWLLGLQVTSKDHDLDAAQEARAGRFWADLGSGAWDSARRPSEARVNRIVRIAPESVRRVGAMLDERVFRDVAREVLRFYGDPEAAAQRPR
ncbi:PemK-like, MazF-like toxin of type II toxin-antitoxin system [Tessaracoccus bendigoensis DSM 12906]|uniref:PemK-like, MazF-like toxin of type II toxin-antitoxin system n=1 Tax=Tessaracoccus bendigoensis DSM 12906 TaxID=1123357 RepID=A0A1M6J005_9ACTN|nr:type II toxin-antitoxin system PemK/MazF family toxin [Tessaracoccus bendigoensis]SHJ40034.1 PemK-like, MazF-like toxin of type II toxin-antitoxin system [Tessaracoccus bendigoensis DSM 12906]